MFTMVGGIGSGSCSSAQQAIAQPTSLLLPSLLEAAATWRRVDGDTRGGAGSHSDSDADPGRCSWQSGDAAQHELEEASLALLYAGCRVLPWHTRRLLLVLAVRMMRRACGRRPTPTGNHPTAVLALVAAACRRTMWVDLHCCPPHVGPGEGL